jgi:hypothetical protein
MSFCTKNPPLREMRTLGHSTKATKRPYGLKLVLFGEIFNDISRREASRLGEIAQSGGVGVHDFSPPLGRRVSAASVAAALRAT